jgi:flagellar hook-length control protein FliK
MLPLEQGLSQSDVRAVAPSAVASTPVPGDGVEPPLALTVALPQAATSSSSQGGGEGSTSFHHLRGGTPDASPAAEHAARILQQVRVALVPGMRQATIQLSPPSLGRVEVRIAVNAGRLRAEVRAERPETLQALAGHVPELRAALAVQGIQADQVDLGLGFGAARDHARGRSRGDGHEASAGASLSTERIHDGELRHALARATAAARGGVDMYA